VTKKAYLVVILLTIIIISTNACVRKGLPGGPCDATPTPAPAVHVGITLLNCGTPVATPVYMTIDAAGGTTNSNGYLMLMVNGFGIHHLIMPDDIANGFTSPLTYNINITKDWMPVVIDRGVFSLDMTLDPKSVNVFTCIPNTVTYHVKYITTTQRPLSLEVDGLPPSFNWKFTPSCVTNNGDTSTLTIQTPKYYQQGYYYAPLTFTAWGITLGYKYPVGDTINGYALYQGWNFRLKYQNFRNEIPIRYSYDLSYNNYFHFILCLNATGGVGTGGNIGTDTQIIDHTNFPDSIPVKIQIVDVQYYQNNAWTSLTSSVTSGAINFGAATTSGTYWVIPSEQGRTLTWFTGPINNFFYVPNTMDLYNGIVYEVNAIGTLSFNENWTDLRFKIRFFNDDGFNMVLTALELPDFSY
jgi:hypothetical protein